MFKISFAIVFWILGSVMSPVVFADGVRLTGNDLVTAVSGKKYSGTTKSGKTWVTTYFDDGKMGVLVLGTSWFDNGTWEIKSDRVCSERSERALMCYEVMRVSEDEYHWVDERGQTTKASGPE